MKERRLPDIKLLTVSIAAIIFGYIVMSVLTPMTYHTNDDMSIANSLSGATFGSIHWFHKFINAFLSMVIGGLYMLDSDVAWWYYFLHASMIIGMLFLNYALLKLTFLGKKLVIGFGGIVIINAAMFWLWVSAAAYTTAPAVLGIGLDALVLLYRDKPAKKQIKIMIPVTLLVLLASLVRSTVGECVMCYVFLALFIIITERAEKINIKQMAFFVMYCLLVFGLITGASKLSNKIKKNVNDDEYRAFNKVRIQFMDHGHDKYADNPAIYEAVGWDEDIYELATHWKFMPDEVNAENLKYIVENSATHVSNKTNIENIKTGIKAIFNSKMMKALALYMIASGALGFVLFLSKKKRYLLYWIANNAGTIIILFYVFCKTGRIILRGLYVVFAPAIIMNLFIVMLSRDSYGEKIKNKLVQAALAGFILASCVACVVNVRYAYDKGKSNRVLEQKQNIIKTYYRDHPDNIYFSESSWSISPRGVKGAGNSRTMGGSGWLNAKHKRWLAKYGFEKQGCELFALDNVYYVGEYDAMTLHLIRYMRNRYDALGIAQIEPIEGLGGFCVFHFVYEDNADDYESYITEKDNEFIVVDKIQ